MSPTRRSFVKAVLGVSTAAILPESAFARQNTQIAPSDQAEHWDGIVAFTRWEGSTMKTVFNGRFVITDSGEITIRHICEDDRPYMVAAANEAITPTEVLRRMNAVANDPALIERGRQRQIESEVRNAAYKARPRCECPKCRGNGWLMDDAALAEMEANKR